MADHVRKQIRDAAIDALTGLATTGTRVFASRTAALEDVELPALRISTNDEQIEIQTLGQPRLLDRRLTLVVEACVKENDDFDDTLDAIIQQVEIAIAANQGLGGAMYVQLTGIEVQQSGESDTDIGVARMSFEVPYTTAFDAPDVALNAT